ncbi:dehydrogenase [Phellopilus nigrolimitatus]|nr:dehydrogenase [Phellopilus nigrolimitatus]
MAPSTMLAVVITGGGNTEVREIAVPTPGPAEILVKVATAAGNPTDWKMVDNHTRVGAVVGCDFAGTVVALGPDVPAGQFTVGDRVAGLVHGAAYPNGAFAEYVVASSAATVPLPASWSFEQAAQLGVAGYTACMCLYYAQALPSPLAPAETPTDILVWGGASAVGQYTVQLARAGGLRVLATASPRNFDLVTSLGADRVFNYADADVSAQIKAATGGALRHAVDCISEGETPRQVEQALGDGGGFVSATLPYEATRTDVQHSFVLAYMLLGKAIEVPMKLPASPEQHAFARTASEILGAALAAGQVKPGPIKLMPAGLASVCDGLEYLRSGKASGEKVTYRIADTPQLKQQ